MKDGLPKNNNRAKLIILYRNINKDYRLTVQPQATLLERWVFVRSAGEASPETIQRYIQNQG